MKSDSMTASDIPAAGNRVLSIDRFKGMLVFCMAFFICAADFPCLGFIARIANNSKNGRIMLFGDLSLADIVTPLFVFLISLTYLSSFKRRYEKCGKLAYLHFVIRYLSFIGMGSIMVSAEYLILSNGSDPYIILTVLMFVVAFLLLLLIPVKLIKPIPVIVGKIIYSSLVATLCILGLLGIALALRDDFMIFILNKDVDIYKHWSILHEIGMTGLLALPFAWLAWYGKLISWIVLFGSYTALQTLPGMIEKFDVVVLGGAAGTLGWLLVMLGGLLLMELFFTYRRGALYYGLISLFYAATAVISCVIFPLNVGSVTSNYMVFSLSCAALIFFLINLLNFWHPKIDFFVWWGRNPLLLFLIGLVLRVIQKAWNPPPDTGLAVALIFTLGGALFMTLIAYVLYKKKIMIKI